MTGLSARLAPFLGLLALIGLWEAAARVLGVAPSQLPAPSLIAATLFNNGPQLLAATTTTLTEALQALVLAAVGGVALALLFAWSPWLDDAFTSRIAFRAGGIYTILPDGSEPVLAVSKENSGARDNYVPAWSPDGGQIAFDAWGRKGETLMRSAADGSTTGASVADAYGWLRRIHWRYELP